MVLARSHIKEFVIFVIFALLMSCEGKPLTVICEDCYGSDPLTADITIKIGASSQPVIISVYSGNLEDNILYKTFQTTDGEETSVNVPINRIYTITATYNIDGDDFIAVDSASPRVLYDEDTCEDPCFYIYDDEVSLRLKYQ